ncbi:MFS general substrate transporter, partial [Delitschia confertaspora ATCC 74209]
GLTAWLQVVVSFFACMNTFGFATAYGLFETFYTDALQKSPFQIAWIGVLPIFFTAFIGIYSSGLADRGCCFSSLLIGCVLQMLGLVLASSVDLQGKLPYLSILAYQGIISGVGNGLVFSPTMWLVSTHFKSRQDLALGIAALGIPVGGIIYTVIGQQLIPIVGIQITLRFMCSVFAVGNIVIITAARPVSRLANPVGNPLFEFSPFKRIDFTFFNLGTYLTHVGLWAVVLYLPAYAFQVLKLDVNGSFNAIIIMNICGILGRVLGPCLSYYALGPQFLHALCTLFSSVVIFCWIAVHNVKGFYIFAGSFGFFSSAVQILFRAACTSLCDDQTRIGASISTSYFMMSTAFLIGGPLGGAVL